MKKLIVGALLLLPVLAGAQGAEPFVLLTWRADSYAPAEFRGKAFPTAYSKITAAVSVLDGGRIADLSRATVSWFLDNDLIAGGPGLVRTSFAAPEPAGALRDLRVEISNFPGGLLLKTVEIPVVLPEVVIEAPFPDRKFSSESIVLTAKPYFWRSAAGLAYNWKVNGQTASDNSGSLRVNLKPGIAPGYNVRAEVTAYNPVYTLESAVKMLSLVFE